MTKFASPGEALRSMAGKEGWTIEDLAEKLAFSTYLTQKLLDDEVPMTAVVAGQLADITGTPLGAWMGLYAKAEQAKAPIGRNMEA